MNRLLIFLAALLSPALLFAQADTMPAVPVVPPDLPVAPIGDLLQQLIDATQSGQWLVVVGIAIALFLSGARLLWNVWSTKDGIKPYLPLLALAMSLAAVLSAGLIAGEGVASIVKSLIAAASVGLTAIGWSDLWKKARESKLYGWVMERIGKTPTAREEKQAKDAAVALKRAGQSLSLDPSGKVLLNGKPFGPA